MADKPSERPDKRINVEDEPELKFWASEFGVAVERRARKAGARSLLLALMQSGLERVSSTPHRARNVVPVVHKTLDCTITSQ
jgi:hypothetical protein